MASRIPWGQRVTAERLTRIELGETLVKQLTYLKQVRVRDIHGCAKIEVDKKSISIFDKNMFSFNNCTMFGMVSFIYFRIINRMRPVICYYKIISHLFYA